MKKGVNKVILIGHVGSQPDLKATKSGGTVVNLTLATTETFKDKQGQQQEQTEWHRITFFNNLANIVGEYVKKGSKIYVEGSLRAKKWDQGGIERHATEIVAYEMQMLDTKKKQDDYDGYAAPW